MVVGAAAELMMVTVGVNVGFGEVCREAIVVVIGVIIGGLALVLGMMVAVAVVLLLADHGVVDISTFH